MNTSLLKARAALFTAMVIWSTSFAVLKVTFMSYDPMFVIWGRQAIASILFIFVIKRLWSRCSYKRGDYKLLLAMAIFEPCMYFTFEAAAITYTTATQAGIITSILPLLVAITAYFTLKERATATAVTGFTIAFAGAAILSIFSEVTESAPAPVLGNFLEFLAMVCAAGYTITLKRLSERYDPFFLTAFQCFTGSVFFLPFILFRTNGIPGEFMLMPALGVLYLGVIVTIFAYGMYSVGVSKVRAGTAAAFVNLIPVFSIFWGWMFLGENLNAAQYAGCGLVFLGVYLSQRTTGKQPVTAEY
ncbi:MAG TPA: DMT family transporter [Spirochaetota bacterium]|nr:DMT family transporter [Spirochaetota bacterium]